jgi:ribose-phosphate pyrophosphokinase
MLYLNDRPVTPTLFPDNTSQVWKLPEIDLMCSTARIRWEFQHEGEFMHLAQLKDLLDANEVKADLFISYLPYARQDKDIDNESTFALASFARLLNYLCFDKVAILDPHSAQALGMIADAQPFYPTAELKTAIAETAPDCICYPDSGAAKKYTSLYWTGLPYITATKVRDQLTGKITSYELNEKPGKRVLIVDDICDGGATFISLSKMLRDGGAEDVNLFVTHGIFSRGVRPLKEAGIGRVFSVKGEADEFDGNIVYLSYSLLNNKGAF